MMNIAVPNEVKKKGDEACFLWETIYDTEHYKPEADTAINHVGEKLEDIYFPIHLSQPLSKYKVLWKEYARYGQPETKEHANSMEIHSNGWYGLRRGGDYNGSQQYKNMLAIMSSSMTLVDELKEKHIGKRFILGSPGSGKSMLCSRVALACARSDFGIEKFAVLLKCRNLKDEHRSLGTIKNNLCGSSEDFEHIAYEMSSTSLTPDRFVALMNRHAEKGDLLLTIDGFDELSNDNKNLLTKSLHNYLNQKEYSQVDVIITARIQEYSYEEMQYVDDIFIYHFIWHLSWQEIQDFIMQWSCNRSNQKQADLNFVNESYRELKEDVTHIIQSLSGTALYLNNFLDIKVESGHIPINMSMYYKYYLQKAFNRRTHDNSIPYERIAEYIAYKMFLGSDNVEMVIDRSKLINYIFEYYEANKRKFRHKLSMDSAQSILNVMECDMALFVPAVSHRGESFGLQFVHLTLQELLCAKAINEHVAGNGAAEYFRHYYSFSNMSSSQMRVAFDNYKQISYNLIKLSNERTLKENEEIERIFIDENLVPFLFEIINEGLQLFQPKQVLKRIFDSENSSIIIEYGENGFMPFVNDEKFLQSLISVTDNLSMNSFVDSISGLIEKLNPEYRDVLKELAEERMLDTELKVPDAYVIAYGIIKNIEAPNN